MINPALCLVGIYTDSFAPLHWHGRGVMVARCWPLAPRYGLARGVWCGSWLSGIGLVNIRNVNLCACIHTIHIDIEWYNMIYTYIYNYIIIHIAMACHVHLIPFCFWAPQAPDLHCHNAMLSSYEKTSQWLRALETLLAFPSARRPCDTDDRNVEVEEQVFQGNWGKTDGKPWFFDVFCHVPKKMCRIAADVYSYSAVISACEKGAQWDTWWYHVPFFMCIQSSSRGLDCR